MSYGIQDDGSFRRKPLDKIIEDKVEEYRAIIGEDIELRPGSPARQILEADAAEQARLWQAMEAVYYASFYQDSFGEMLDKHLALAGFSRRGIRPATGEVIFSRNDAAPDDISIPAGTVVTTQSTETRPRIPFETRERAVIREGETEATAAIEALKPWQTDVDEEWLGEETNVAANTIVRFDSPVSGVDDVTNPEQTGDEAEGFTPGRDRETDAEFKLRYETTLASGGKATLEAIRSEVSNVSENIVSVSIEENDTLDDNTDDGGLPPKSFRLTVLEDEEVPDDTIAQAILDSRAAGISSYGEYNGIAELDGGVEITEEFDRADEVDIEVDATITTTDSFPDSGVTQIEDAIIEYIGGEDSEGVDYAGLEIGEDVIYDQVFRRILEIRGVVEADLHIGEVDETLGESNIEIGIREAAMTASDDIEVSES